MNLLSLKKPINVIPNSFATQYGSSNTRIDGVPESTVIDNPLDGATIQDDVFTIRGWAIYPPAASGTGVTNVHVWLDAPSPPNGQFLGGATYGIDRPDVASLYGETYRYSGIELTWDARAVAPGTHTLYIAARHPDASWSADLIRTVTIQVPTPVTPSPTPVTPSPTPVTPSPTPVTPRHSVYLPMIYSTRLDFGRF